MTTPTPEPIPFFHWNLISEIEQSFDITIAEAEALSAQTFGQLCDLVLSKFPLPPKDGSLRAAAFFRLRRALTRGCGINRLAIRPDAKLTELLPPRTRRRAWNQLQSWLEFPLNQLDFPNWLYICAVLSTVIAVITLILGLGMWFIAREYYWGSILIGIPVAVIATVIALHNTQQQNPLADRIPGGYATIGQMVNQITMKHYAHLSRHANIGNANEIRDLLSDMIVEHCVVDKTTVNPEFALDEDKDCSCCG